MPRAVGKPSQHPDVVIPLGSVEPPAPRPRSPASAALSSVAHGDPSSIPACRPSNRKTSRSTRSTRPSPSAASPRCSYRRDRRRATGELVEIDAVQRAVEGQVDPVVLRPSQARRSPRPVASSGRRCSVPAPRRGRSSRCPRGCAGRARPIDTPQMEQVGEHEAYRSGADDADLGEGDFFCHRRLHYPFVAGGWRSGQVRGRAFGWRCPRGSVAGRRL